MEVFLITIIIIITRKIMFTLSKNIFLYIFLSFIILSKTFYTPFVHFYEIYLIYYEIYLICLKECGFFK